MRRICSAMFALICLFVAGTVPVYAQEALAVHFSADQTNSATNDSVTFDLSFSGEEDVAAFDMALTIAPSFAFESVTAVGMPAADLSYYFREGKLNLLYLDNTGGLKPMKPGTVLLQIQVRALAQTTAPIEVFSLSTYNFSGVDGSGAVVTFPSAVTQDAVQVSGGNTITAEDASLPAAAVVIDGEEKDAAEYIVQEGGALPEAGGSAATASGSAAMADPSAEAGIGANSEASPSGVTSTPQGAVSALRWWFIGGAAALVLTGVILFRAKQKKR